jgi:hypothetical protein
MRKLNMIGSRYTALNRVKLPLVSLNHTIAATLQQLCSNIAAI